MDRQGPDSGMFREAKKYHFIYLLKFVYFLYEKTVLSFSACSWNCLLGITGVIVISKLALFMIKVSDGVFYF